MLTVGQGRSAVAPVSKSGGVARAEREGEAVAGGAPESGLRGSTPGESARPAEGLTGPELHRR